MLVLGSKSKARYNLLRIYNAEIKQISADTKEEFRNDLSIEENLMNIAREKAFSLQNQINKDDILITADTVCINNNQIMTKPKNYEEAFEMIKSYSNNTIQVMTGVYISYKEECHNFYDVTSISFEHLDDETIQKYLYENQEYKVIAGALAIEKIKNYVNYTYQGSYSNIIGLPMERISHILYDGYLLDDIDYETKVIEPINIYRSSVRVLPTLKDKVYLLKGYTSDLKETYYMSIGGGYHRFEDKEEILQKEAQEEGGLSLSHINPLLNIAEYNQQNRFIQYTKLTLHAYYTANIEDIGQPSYVEYENELLIGIEAFDYKEAQEILVKQYQYFLNKPYPIAIITTCDLQALNSLINFKDSSNIIYNMHDDILSDLAIEGLKDNTKSIFNLKHLNNFKKGNIQLSVLNLWLDVAPHQSKQRMLEFVKTSAKQLTLTNDNLNVIRTTKDINKEKINAVLGLEGLDYMDSADDFYVLNQLGFKLAALTWNYSNKFACSCTTTDDTGLSEEGIKLVKILNELNTIIDISHLSDKSAKQVIEKSTKPIVASHSNARALCNHPRNLSDELLLLIKENNGVVGINAFSKFVNEQEPITIDMIVDHIDYIKNLIGIDHIGLGFDFTDYLDIEPELDKKLYYPADLHNQAQSQQIIEKLKERNYTKQEIRQITHLNFKRIMEEVLDA